jgi:putative transcriptional regulator
VTGGRLLRALASAVCAPALLLALAWPAAAGDPKPPTSILLVARADLPDPNFRDAVVLVLNNLGPAPAGVIVNRPTRIGVSALFPDAESLAKLDAKVYFGGPVAASSLSFLVRADAPPEGAVEVAAGVYLSADRDLLRKLLGRDEPMKDLRIFIGSAGWGPGQLEAEIARGDWTLAPATPEAIFERKPEHPWPEPDAPPDDVHRT